MKLTIPMSKPQIYWGWAFYLSQLLALPVLLALVNRLLGEPLTITGLNIALFLVNFVLTLVIFHSYLFASLQKALKAPFQCLRSAVLGFGCYYLASLLVGLFIQTVCPEFSNINDRTILQMVEENYAWVTVCVVLLVPITEETLYRGLIFKSLYHKSPVLAYCVSTLVFGLIHVVGYIGTVTPFMLLMCFLQYLPAGLALAWAFVRSDTIWAPILMHIAINQIGLSAMR